jgi:hypothetical protein
MVAAVSSLVMVFHKIIKDNLKRFMTVAYCDKRMLQKNIRQFGEGARKTRHSLPIFDHCTNGHNICGARACHYEDLFDCLRQGFHP